MKDLVNAALHDRHSLWGLRPWRRHSLVLVVLGGVYVLTGLLYALAPSTPTRNESLKVALDLWGWKGWGAAWVVVGLMAMISSRWPIPSEKWGYTAMTFMAAFWACMYFWGWVKGAPVASLGQTLLWGGVAFVFWAISGLVNPAPADLRPPPHGRGDPW